MTTIRNERKAILSARDKSRKGRSTRPFHLHNNYRYHKQVAAHTRVPLFFMTLHTLHNLNRKNTTVNIR